MTMMNLCLEPDSWLSGCYSRAKHPTGVDDSHDHMQGEKNWVQSLYTVASVQTHSDKLCKALIPAVSVWLRAAVDRGTKHPYIYSAN